MDENYGLKQSQLNLNLFLRVGIVAIRIPCCCGCHARGRRTGKELDFSTKRVQIR